MGRTAVAAFCRQETALCGLRQRQNSRDSRPPYGHEDKLRLYSWLVDVCDEAVMLGPDDDWLLPDRRFQPSDGKLWHSKPLDRRRRVA